MKLATQIILAVVLAFGATATAASVRELSATELRKIVKAGDAVSLKRAIDAVSTSLGGEPIEARAFEADGVFYRIVVKRSNGKLVSVIIDAGTGRQVAKESSIGREINAAVASGKGSGPGTGKDSGTGKGPGTGKEKSQDSGGKSNSGGSGNAGGKGSGNGGGNGNGNGNGNGGGNGNGRGNGGNGNN